jgi:ribonuclease HI
MSKSVKTKFYVVWKGATPGVYRTWAEAQAQVKNYPGARYQAFPTEAAARQAFIQGAPPPAASVKKAPQKKATTSGAPIIWDSISVDAACSGNPGKMEYRGVDTRTGEELFHQAFPLGTNNIGEFLAIVHGLAWLRQKGIARPIYTDSRNAVKWVQAGKCKTTLPHNAKTDALFAVIARAEQWLANNAVSTKIMKWNTEEWGEIPADFGRK